MSFAPDSDAMIDLVQRLHEATGPKVVLHVAGGGTEIFPWLLARGGGSSTLLSGRIPYDRADFIALLGADPGRLVDARAARGLAMAGYRHGVRLRPDLGANGVVGIGATSKLSRGVDDREGRTHEIHLALQASDQTLTRSITLPPGGNRLEQERINAHAILNLVAEARGLAGLPVPLNQRPTTEAMADASTCGHPDLPALLSGRRPWLALRTGSSEAEPISDSDQSPTRLILPGSFRPLHAGHLRMAEIAAEVVGEPCAFELSLFHPEKPPLDYLSIADRTARFAGVPGWLLLTDAPTYLDKARLFPSSTFVVGYDTAVRIVEPRWYGGVTGRDAMLDELEALGSRFLVFGRVDASGQFRDLGTEAFEEPRVARFVAQRTQVVAEDRFRLDLSSTLVRLSLDAELP